MVTARTLLLCTFLCSLSLLQLPKATGDAGGGLGRRGGASDDFTRGRRLLGSSEAEQGWGRTAPDARGAGALHAPRRAFVAPTKDGHVSVAGDVVTIPVSALTASYPEDGIAYAVPAQSASTTVYSPARPYIHMYPLNYTMLFIPASSSYFGGYHWAIYDEAKSFYSYDDGDATDSDYNYDESEELPAGCEYVDSRALMQPHILDFPKASSSATPAPASSQTSALSALEGSSIALGSASTAAQAPANLRQLKALETSSAAHPAPGTAAPDSAQAEAPTQGGQTGRKLISVAPAPAPAPVRAPRNATLAAAREAAMVQEPGKTPGSATILVQMLCKPVPAKVDPSTQPDSHRCDSPPWWDGHSNVWTALLICFIVIVIISNIVGVLCKGRRGNNRQQVAPSN